jgi:hypothetical protein
MSIAGVVVVAWLSLGGQAMAGEAAPPMPRVFSPERLEPFVRQAVEAAEVRRQAPATAGRTSRRDSIWNGGLIGAAVGGVGGSALIVASRGGSDNIPRAMLNVCVGPALAGFAAGAIIDALH